MGYTVKDVKSIIENLSNDTPIFGFILGPNDVEIYTQYGDRTPFSDDSQNKDYMMPNAEEWASVVNKAEDLAIGGGGMTIWDGMWECMNDAKAELFPEDGEDD